MGLQGKVRGMTNPWNGVLTATATPFKADLSVDYDKYAEHVAWLAANGTHGVIPNGSLGEYQVLTAEERAKMVEVAVAAAPKGFSVVPGVAAYGAAESRKWAEHAQKAGVHAPLYPGAPVRYLRGVGRGPEGVRADGHGHAPWPWSRNGRWAHPRHV